MLNKKWLLAAVVIVLAAGIVYWADKQQNKPAAEQPEQKFDLEKNSLVGQVVSATADQIIINSDSQEVVVKVSSQTELVKQHYDAKAQKASVVEAAISDFSPGVMVIVVYFSEPGAGNAYQADKVQIISQ